MLRIQSAASNCIIASSDESGSGGKTHRPLANFPADIYASRFASRFASFTQDKQLCNQYIKEIEPLKEEVREKIVAKESNRAAKLNLIDTVERLGISYHFEQEIEQQLHIISSGNGLSEKCSDLDTISLQFRLFRQHGFDISSDIFEQFTTKNGKFKQSLIGDTRGLLSLYEASYLRTHSDSILDDALIFTTNHLMSSELLQNNSLCPSIKKLVKRALEQPLHRGVPRLEAWHFISAYEADFLKDEALLRIAKLDYNLLQLKYNEELATLLRYWKELDLASNVPYVKDRLVINYFVALALEPHYLMHRILTTKCITLGQYIEDTYDAYGTSQELDLLTTAMQRWDMNEISQLPESIKAWYSAFLKTFEEFEQFTMKQGRSYAFYHVKQAWKEFVACNHTESKWLFGKEINPTFDEWMNNGCITVGVKATITMCYLAMDSATESAFDWLSHNPEMLVSASKISRLRNDLASFKFEKERGVTTSINCYMKNYKVSEEEAEMKFKEMYEDCWKNFNQEYCCNKLAKPPLTRSLFQVILNSIRIMDEIYRNNDDGFTDPKINTGPTLEKLLLLPFAL